MSIAPSHRPSHRDKYTIIIPAAGMGRRMKTYGPKSLLPISTNECILEKQLVTINNTFKYYEVILIGGFEFKTLENKTPNGIKLIENKDYDTTNVLHSISLGLEAATTNKVLIIYGDLIFNQECLMAPFYKESCLILSDYMKSDEVGCVTNNHYVNHMFYQLDNKWAQIAFLTGKELEMLIQIAKDNPHWFGFEAINSIIDNGGKFYSFKPKKANAIDIDSSVDLKVYENSYKDFTSSK